MTPPGSFAAFSLLEYGGLNPILSSLGGRSDAARRVVILPFAVPVDAHVVANDGRWRCVGTESPQTPTVGAGSSQREDSPTRHLAIHISCAPQMETPRFLQRRGILNRDAARHVATNALRSVLSSSLQTPHPSRKPCSYTLGSIFLARTLSRLRRVEISSV